MPGNVERFERALAAWRQRDLDALLELVHPEVELVALRSATEGAYRGHDGFRTWFEDSLDNYDVFDPRYDEMRELDGDRLLATGTIRLRGKGSGLEMDAPTAAVMSFRDGLLHRWRDYGNRADALAAAGLSD